VDRGPGGARSGRRGRRRPAAAADDRDLRRDLRAGRVAVPARGAEDRRGALTRAVARAVVALTAVLVLGWLGVMERNVRLQERAAAALRSTGDPAVLARAETDLRRAN